MISVEALKNMSDEILISTYKALNHWIWPPILGEELEGWSNMPNYIAPYMDKCTTKEDIIKPYMYAIKERLAEHHIRI